MRALCMYLGACVGGCVRGCAGACVCGYERVDYAASCTLLCSLLALGFKVMYSMLVLRHGP